MTDRIETTAALAIVLAAFALGWAIAHSTVATECERLGSFYVGQKVFDCKEKKNDRRT